MKPQIRTDPDKCTGCTSCALTCSLIHHGEFNLEKSNIRIYKNDFTGNFRISILTGCYNCGQCVKVCPAGALSVISKNSSPE